MEFVNPQNQSGQYESLFVLEVWRPYLHDSLQHFDWETYCNGKYEIKDVTLDKCFVTQKRIKNVYDNDLFNTEDLYHNQ